MRKGRSLTAVQVLGGALLALFVAAIGFAPSFAQSSAKPGPTAQTGTAGQPGQAPAQSLNRQWLGYSLSFQAIRPLLQAGDFAGAKIAFETGKDASGAPIPLPAQPVGAQSTGQAAATSGLLASLAAAQGQGAGAGAAGATTSPGVMQPLASATAPFITNVELGTLLLDSGDATAARAAFDGAGQLGATAAAQTQRSTASRMGGALRAIGRAAATAAGNAEMGAYDAPDHERILQLNYLALSYLLLGDDKAFNVSQRNAQGQRDAFESLNDKAAKLQDEARAAFEAERAAAQARLTEAQGNPDDATGVNAVEGQLSAAYQTEDNCTPPNLPSAYVNPLSFYLNGIVYEIASAQFPEDRETARISYEKALQLAPNAGVLNAAVRDLNSQQVRAGRLTHVLVAEGFAPTRQTIRMQLTYGDIVAPITIPRLTCHPSDVAAIEVRTPDGRTLQRLDPVANIEGIMLQRQKDREGITALSVFTNALRGAMENRLAQQNIVANLLVQAKQSSFDRPDMRGWSTLPARMHGGRVYVPNNLSQVQIVSLNAQGRVIATSVATLDTQSRQNFIYARAVQSRVAVAPAAPLWIRGL